MGDGTQDWWEVHSHKWWEAGDLPHKQVGDGRLDPKTGGRWEVEIPATHPSTVSHVAHAFTLKADMPVMVVPLLI